MGPIEAVPDHCPVIFSLDVFRVKLPLWMSVLGLFTDVEWAPEMLGHARHFHVSPPFDVWVCRQMTVLRLLRSVHAWARLPLPFNFIWGRREDCILPLNLREDTTPGLMAVPNTRFSKSFGVWSTLRSGSVIINKMISASLKTNLFRFVVSSTFSCKPLISWAAGSDALCDPPGDAAAVLSWRSHYRGVLCLHDDFAVCGGQGRKSFQLFHS